MLLCYVLIFQARKFYESAIRLEPGFLGAALALADLHAAEGRNKEAVLLLERYLRQWADDSLHIKLAQVYAATDLLSDALSHYQAALRYTSPWSWNCVIAILNCRKASY
jgi:anaphase-promoting complex subunit 7